MSFPLCGRPKLSQRTRRDIIRYGLLRRRQGIVRLPSYVCLLGGSRLYIVVSGSGTHHSDEVCARFDLARAASEPDLVVFLAMLPMSTSYEFSQSQCHKGAAVHQMQPFRIQTSFTQTHIPICHAPRPAPSRILHHPPQLPYILRSRYEHGCLGLGYPSMPAPSDVARWLSTTGQQLPAGMHCSIPGKRGNPGEIQIRKGQRFSTGAATGVQCISLSQRETHFKPHQT